MQVKHTPPSMNKLIQSVGPPSFGRFAELSNVAKKVLLLSGIGRKDRVIILADTRTNTEIVQSFFSAAISLGSECVVLYMTPISSMGDPSEWIISFLETGTLVINLLSMEWGKQPGAKRLTQKGVRVIMCAENPDTLIKMAPDRTVMRRVDKLVDLVNKSSKLKLSSKSGTTIEWKKENAPAPFLKGILDRKELWTNFPNSVVGFPFKESSGTGKIVLEPGDVFIHLAYMLREHVTLEIEKSKIKKIRGGYDADILEKKWFRRWNDPTKYKLLHIDFGCDHRAEVLPTIFSPMEWESYLGGVVLGFGHLCHIDMMVSKHDVWLDNTKIIEGGTYIYS
jgi:hypothetical protein